MSHSRWGKTATTWSPTTRIVLSVPIVAVWLVLGLSTLKLAATLEPVSVLALVATGIYTMYALPVVRYLWTANDHWKYAKAQQAARAHDIRTLASRQRPPESAD